MMFMGLHILVIFESAVSIAVNSFPNNYDSWAECVQDTTWMWEGIKSIYTLFCPLNNHDSGDGLKG